MKLKDKIVKNRVGILIFIGVLLVVTIIIGISYAYFFNIEIKNNNTISGNINTKYYTFESSGNSTLSLAINQSDLDMANASNDYSSFVSGNGGNINVSLNANGLKKVYCSYDLVYEPVSPYTKSEGATNAGLKEFTLSGTSDKGNSFNEIEISGSNKVTLISGVKISTDTNILENWTFTAKYYNLDVIQDNVAGKTFKGNIKVANSSCSFNEPKPAGPTGGDYVLLKGTGASSVTEAKSQISNKGTPDFSKVATTNEGLFKAQDDLGDSYYFRGAVDNNWVKFGKDSSGNDIYWRIIRINSDGSIRMIYTGTTAPTESTKVVMTGEGTQIGKSTFNSSKDNAEYVGYMYAPEQQHGTSTSSDIKTTIDNWYETTTLKTDSATKSLVADQIFCNDRSPSSIQTAAWTSTGANYSYGANGRISSDKTPILKCGAASDKFTSKNSSIGNKALEYPVGLITADEIAMAGGVYGSSNSNSSYYLYTNQFYWSGSPYYFRSSGIAYGFTVSSLGYVTSSYVPYDIGARPVISLSSEAKLTGDGTWNNVYEVEKKGYETILANNTVHETAPDFSTVTTASDKGMYSAQDDLGTSYYFRGSVDNNWVKYGKYTKDMYNCNNGTISATDTGNSCTKIASNGDDMYWRIIRINGDGSIRMIYSGVTPPTESTKVIKTTDTSLGNSSFNKDSNSAEYVGYMYTIGEQHGTSQSSDIKTFLDNWYANYTDLNKTGTKITDQIYCNDRTASTSDVAYSTTNYTTLTSWNSTGTTYYYGANGRVWNDPVSPDYKCPVASDKFTTTTTKGNGKLTNPVGLITADEITFAGLPAGKTNNSFYLYTGAYYWAGSPYAFGGDTSGEFLVDDVGSLDLDLVYSTGGVRGVVSLSSESKLLGSGTYNDVYTVN